MFSYDEHSKCRMSDWMGGCPPRQYPERKRGRRHGHPKKIKAESKLNVFFANVTSCSKEAMTYIVNNTNYHVNGIAETHKRGDDLQKIIEQCKTTGWKTIAAPAEQSDRSPSGTFGGMLSLTSRGCKCAMPLEMDPTSHCVDSPNMIHHIIRLHGMSLVVIFVYLKDNVGIKGDNVAILNRIAAIKNSSGMQTLVMGDFNVSPTTLIESGYPELMDMTVIHEPFADGTCRHSGKEHISTID